MSQRSIVFNGSGSLIAADFPCFRGPLGNSGLRVSAISYGAWLTVSDTGAVPGLIQGWYHFSHFNIQNNHPKLCGETWICYALKLGDLVGRNRDRSRLFRRFRWTYRNMSLSSRCRQLGVVERCRQPGVVSEMVEIWVFPKINGTPKSSILIGFSIISHPFWGTPIFGNTNMLNSQFSKSGTLTFGRLKYWELQFAPASISLTMPKSMVHFRENRSPSWGRHEHCQLFIVAGEVFPWICELKLTQRIKTIKSYQKFNISILCSAVSLLYH